MGYEDALAFALSAGEAWGGLADNPELIRDRENIVFRAQLLRGTQVALRLHRPGYQTAEAIRSEQRWTESLADTGFACPWPERTEDKDFIFDPKDGRPIVSVVRWVPGVPIGETGVPYRGDAARQNAVYRQLGALLADLHLTADATSPPDLERRAWNRSAFCDPEAPIWGRYWENPALDHVQSNLLCAARDLACERLSAIPSEQTGLIHADVLQENVLQDGKQMYLIDFGESGVGYRLYDLATALIQHVETPVYTELRQSLLKGYQAAQGPLPQQAFDDLEMFVMLRAMASAGWIAAHASDDDPLQSHYALRAVRCAEAFLT